MEELTAFLASISALFSINARATSVCPLELASINAVQPSCDNRKLEAGRLLGGVQGAS